MLRRGVRTTWLRVDDQGSFVLQGEGGRSLCRHRAGLQHFAPPLNKRHARCQLLTGELFAATPGLRFLLDLQRDSVQYSCPNQTKALSAHKFYSKINATSLESNMSISTKEKIYDIDILVF